MITTILILGGCPQSTNGNSKSTQYTITFESHGGTAVAAITEDEGTAVPRPTDPTLSGYAFQGWFDAASGGTEYTWPHTLIADITMHALWEVVLQFTITFERHGGSAVAAITEDEGTAVPRPTDPTLSGYAFQGWFDAASGGTEYTWPHTLNADVTMHAQWQKWPDVPVTIAVWVNEDGAILDSNDDITISKNSVNEFEDSFTAMVTGEYSGIQWDVDGDPVQGSPGTAQSITINAADYVKGGWYLGVTISKDGVPYSTAIYFTVID
jgi:hypothetical protein